MNLTQEPTWDKPHSRRRTAFLSDNVTITEQTPKKPGELSPTPTIILKTKTGVFCFIHFPPNKTRSRSPLVAFAAAARRAELNEEFWTAMLTLISERPNSKGVRNLTKRTTQLLLQQFKENPGKFWSPQALRLWFKLAATHFPEIAVPPELLSRVL